MYTQSDLTDKELELWFRKSFELPLALDIYHVERLSISGFDEYEISYNRERPWTLYFREERSNQTMTTSDIDTAIKYFILVVRHKFRITKEFYDRIKG